MERCVERAEAVCKSYPRLCHKCLSFREETNADRIRAMSDEELAKWVLQFVFDCAVATGIENPEWEDGAEEEMLKWLKQPAEGENDG